jgi:predicted transcriptional regulator
VLALREAGRTVPEIAEATGLRASTVKRLLGVSTAHVDPASMALSAV